MKEEQQRRMEEEKRRIKVEQKFSQLQNQLQLPNDLLNALSSKKVASNTQKSDNKNYLISPIIVQRAYSSKSESHGSKRVMENANIFLYHVLC